MRSASYLLITAALALTAHAQPEYCKNLPADCGSVPKECLAAVQPPLVYTRQPRIAEEFANWQHWYDAGLPNRFTESDVVLDDRMGHTNVIHDCTTKPEVCAAHDARVSPDGLRILYTVAHGTGLYPVKLWGSTESTPPIEFQATSYDLWLYDLKTKTSALLEKNARQGDWTADDGIIFTSDRDGDWVPWALGNDYPMKALHVFEAKIAAGKLTNLRSTAPHVFAMNPTTLTNGMRCFSGYQGFGDRGINHTPSNMWWVECYNADGTGHRIILGAHGSPALKTRDYLTTDSYRSGEGSAQFKVLRPLAEIKRGKLAVPSYYRSNHIGGMGILYSFGIPGDAEGCSQEAGIIDTVYKSTVPGSGRYAPCDLKVLTPYANDQDTTNIGTRIDKQGRAMGKAGNPAASVDGAYMFTQARGSCYEGTMPAYNTREAMGGEPTCKLEIRKALVERITDPFDKSQSIIIACPEDKWNCRDARVVTSYQKLFGQPAPSAQ